jgi:hypothetical protein
MVFIVAGTLFAYLAFVHPIGTQFVGSKVTMVMTEAKKIVKEQIQPTQAKKEQAAIDARPVATPVVTKMPTVPKRSAALHPGGAKNGSKPPQPAIPRKAAPVVKTKAPPSRVENPFKLDRSEFSRADIDAIIEQRRRIKDKLGEL